MPRRSPPTPLNLQQPVATRFAKYTLPRDPTSVQDGVFIAPVRPARMTSFSQGPITRLPSMNEIRSSLSIDGDREVLGMHSRNSSSSTLSMTWSDYGSGGY